MSQLIRALLPLLLVVATASAAHALAADHKCKPYEDALTTAQANLTAATAAVSAARADLTAKQDAMNAAEAVMNEPPVTPAEVHAYNTAKAARDAAQAALTSAENHKRQMEFARDRARRDLQECLKRFPAAPSAPLPPGEGATAPGKK